MFTTLTVYFPVPKNRVVGVIFRIKTKTGEIKQPNFNIVLNILSRKSNLKDAINALLQCVISSFLSVVPLQLALTQNYPNSVEHIYLHRTTIIYLIGLDEPEVKISLDAF